MQSRDNRLQFQQIGLPVVSLAVVLGTHTCVVEHRRDLPKSHLTLRFFCEVRQRMNPNEITPELEAGWDVELLQ